MINTKQIPWMRIITEGCVIVVSILLAFAIDAWWSERIEREQEREHLLAMRSEFQSSIEGLNGVYSSIQQHAKTIEELIIELKSVEHGQSILVSAERMGSVNVWRTTDVSTSTLTALMSSGNLNQLSNPALRSALAGFPAVLLDMTEDEIVSQRFAEQVMSTYLVKAGLAEIVYANRGGNEALKEILTTAPSEIAVIHTPELINLLTVRRLHLFFSELSIPEVTDYLTNLISMIDDELD